MEVHIGPAIAVFFFNDYDRFRLTKCYLVPKAVERLDPFLPVLQTLVESWSFPFYGAHHPQLARSFSEAVSFAVHRHGRRHMAQKHPESVPFWIDNDTGRRICVLIDDVWRGEPALLDQSQKLRNDVDQLLAAPVRIGVADAARLEKALLTTSTRDS